MSTEVTSEPAAPVVEPAAPELKPKNTQRLNRFRRKPKSALTTRPWRPTEDARASGVTAERLRELIAGLTEDEHARAAAGQDPQSVVQEELAKRAARFGITLRAEPAVARAPAFQVDEATLKQREARFQTAVSEEDQAAMNARLARFGAVPSASAPAKVELKLSEEDRAAMEARARRFGLN